jgi:predicted nucleic acid-binding protein
MEGKILIDTSAWIEFFRKRDERIYSLVAALLREEKAVGSGLIILELLRGGKSQKELNVINELFYLIDNVQPKPETFLLAGKMGYELSKKGSTLAVVDLLIAQLSIENHLALLSLGKHFKVIAATFDLKLFDGLS